MNHRKLCWPRKTCKGILAGAVGLAVLFASQGVGANEKYGMPSEAEARQQGYTSTSPSAEQSVRLESLRKQEDRLFVNGEPFVLPRQMRVEDERGARIGLEDIPLGAQIVLHYRRGSRLEDSGYGPETKILTKIRMVEPPPKKKPVP